MTDNNCAIARPYTHDGLTVGMAGVGFGPGFPSDYPVANCVAAVPAPSANDRYAAAIRACRVAVAADTTRGTEETAKARRAAVVEFCAAQAAVAAEIDAKFGRR